MTIGSTTTWRRAVAAVVGLCVVALASCSGSSNPSEVRLSKAEPGLQRAIAKEWFPTLTVGAVKCPNAVTVQQGKTTDCTVTVEGQELGFRVVQTNRKGGVAPARYDALLSTAKTEEAIRRKYIDVVSVSCADTPYFVQAPGKEFGCDVTAQNGRKAQVIMVVNSLGDFRFIRNT